MEALFFYHEEEKKMSFMEGILKQNISVWDKCIATMFVQDMKHGKLPAEDFKEYMVQDSIYLKNYARVYGKAIYHAETLREIQLYYSILNFVTDYSGNLQRNRKAGDQDIGISFRIMPMTGMLSTPFDGKEICHFDTVRINTKNTHGTGCTFSSAVASQLARGVNLREAVQKAKDYVTMAIEHSLDIGRGSRAGNHRRLYFGTAPGKNISSLDFYALAQEIKKVTDSYGIPLIINDRIDIAMAVGADGVHIGQKVIPANIARKVIGQDMLLGVSAVIAESDIKK